MCRTAARRSSDRRLARRTAGPGIEAHQPVRLEAGLDKPDAVLSSTVSAYGRAPLTGHVPLLDLSRRGIEPADHSAGVVAVPDGAVGRDSDAAGAGVWVGSTYSLIAIVRGIDRPELVGTELVEPGTVLRIQLDAVRPSVGCRQLYERDLARPRWSSWPTKIPRWTVNQMSAVPSKIIVCGSRAAGSGIG